MRRSLAVAAVFLVCCGAAKADSNSQAPLNPPVLTTDQLGGIQPSIGTTVFVSDCRAITSAILGVALTVQGAGQGKGCLSTYTANGWVIDGTTMPVQK